MRRDIVKLATAYGNNRKAFSLIVRGAANQAAPLRRSHRLTIVERESRR